MPEAAIARLLSDVVAQLPSVTPAVGLYAAGSLGTRDFVADRSDLDLVAVLSAAPDKGQLAGLAAMHRALAEEHPAGARLHCLYVPADELTSRSRAWPYWSHGRMRSRRFDAIARAELHDHGVVVAGPPVSEAIPFVTPEELADDVRTDLGAVWAPAARRRLRWLRNGWVDVGLTVLPRAEAAMTDSTLITKTQAIARLGDFGVPVWVREDVLFRRRGRGLRLGPIRRVRRARIVRRAMAIGTTRLLAPDLSARRES
jgi:hypothetical protein